MKIVTAKRVLLSATLVLLLLHCATAFQEPARSHAMGEEMQRAAAKRDWERVKVLLEQGADPNVTELTPDTPIPDSDWRAKSALQRPSLLSQAAAQGNTAMVKLLLLHKAEVNVPAGKGTNPLWSAVNAGQVETVRLLLAAGADTRAKTPGDYDVVRAAAHTGKHDLIRLVEDAAKVPVYKRNVPQVPFAPGAQEAKPRVIPGTVGAVPMRHFLWVSDHELLILRDSPRRFMIIDTVDGKETALPELSLRWSAQEQFDPDMLALSPDGNWLVGFGGERSKATWLASEVRGARWQEWPRTVRPDAVNSMERTPPIAWIDNKRWVEINRDGPSYVARIRTRESLEVEQLPVNGAGFLNDFSLVLFHFYRSDQGYMDGVVGSNDGVAGDGDGYYIWWPAFLFPAPAGWRFEQSQVIWKQAEYSGFFFRCVVSPKRDRLAWLNYFSESEAMAILVSDAQGKNTRIAYENIYRLVDYEQGRAVMPWIRTLEWTPRGDALAFWRGAQGNNGLCLLPVPPSR